MGKKSKNKSLRTSQGVKSDDEGEIKDSQQPPLSFTTATDVATSQSSTLAAATAATSAAPTTAPVPTPASTTSTSAAATASSAAAAADDNLAMTPDYSSILNQHSVLQTVRQWIQDDIPSTFDVGALVVGTAPRQATLWMKSSGVFAGKPFFDAVFASLDCQVDWNKQLAKEGSFINVDLTSSKKVELATVYGPVNKILQGERTALNTLSRCSGVATASHAAVAIAKLHDWKGWIAGTRKTTPGFRLVEKYGLLVGGAATHRLDLSQMVMLKDNHVMAANGSITRAVALARKAAGFSQKIEVECQSQHEAMEAARAGADIVMLDNFTPQQLKHDAASIKRQFPHVLIEASGGITEETMGDYLVEHVDIVSLGKLTQGYACLDFSLKVSNNNNNNNSSSTQGKAVSIPLVQQKVPAANVIKVAAATVPSVMQQQVKAPPVVRENGKAPQPSSVKQEAVTGAPVGANDQQEENYEVGSLIAKFEAGSPNSANKPVVVPPIAKKDSVAIPELPIANNTPIEAKEESVPPVGKKTEPTPPVIATKEADSPTPPPVVKKEEAVVVVEPVVGVVTQKKQEVNNNNNNNNNARRKEWANNKAHKVKNVEDEIEF